MIADGDEIFEDDVFEVRFLRFSNLLITEWNRDALSGEMEEITVNRTFMSRKNNIYAKKIKKLKKLYNLRPDI